MEYVEPSLPKVQRNLQKVQSFEKSGENEVDLMIRARRIYRDDNKNNTFNHEDAWAVLRKHLKWDAPDPAHVDLTEGENVPDEHVPAVNTEELFGPDARPRPPDKQRPEKNLIRYIGEHRRGSSSAQFGEFMTHEFRLKREAAEKAFEVAKEKDRTITRLEELRCLALSTKDLSDDDAYYINLQKQAIKDKLKLQMPRPSNNNDYNNDDDDETEDEEQIFFIFRMFFIISE
ncbi:hypothetical protein Tco_0986049 [Tanacetum coccineum]